MEDTEVIVGTGTTPCFQLLGGKVTGQVVDGGAFGCQTDKLLGGMLGEGDIFRTVLQLCPLSFYDALYGSCFLFGGLVGFQFEDKAGFQAFCLVQILLQGRELFAVVQFVRRLHTLAVASCIVTPLKVAS